MRINPKFICLSIVFTFLVIMASNVTVADASEVGTLTKVASNVEFNSYSHSYPIISPDGNEILFTRDDGLYKVSSDGIEEKKLSDGASNISYVCEWSPSGNEILFAKHAENYTINLYKVLSDGSGEIKLSDDVSNYAWSPDGSQISYCQHLYDNEVDAFGYDLSIMNSDGTNKIQLLDPVLEMGFITYTWFPSSSKIAYAIGYHDWGLIRVINSDGSDDHELNNSSNANGDIKVSPDESKIAYLDYVDGLPEEHQIHVQNLNQNTDVTFKGFGFSWSPDSSKIAYFSVENGNLDIYTIKADGTGKIQLTSDAANKHNPVFSPDGSKILFVSDIAGNDDIWVMDADGNNKVQLTTDTASDSDPVWSPDGKKIAFYSEREGDHGIYILTLKIGSDSVTNLQSDNGTTWINWTWTNPTDPDFNHTEIYLNDTFQTNTSAEYFNATDLKPEASYTIGTHTVDIYGNVNETWVNATATTLKAPVPVFPGYTNPPTDQDKDGLYEDINGNGMLDFDDVVAYYDNMEWIEENMQVESLDYNNNGIIDFDDVVKLYDML